MLFEIIIRKGIQPSTEMSIISLTWHFGAMENWDSFEINLGGIWGGWNVGKYGHKLELINYWDIFENEISKNDQKTTWRRRKSKRRQTDEEWGR